MKIDRLKEIVSYDPATGIFRWCEQTAFCVRVGSEINSVDDKGYIRFNILKNTYRAHRLAWAVMTGAWPSGWIDHINGNRADNRWCNLRVTTRQVNVQNQSRPHKQNKVGLLGVCREGGSFKAQITVSGKNFRLGNFSTALEAHEAYLRAKREMHEGCTI